MKNIMNFRNICLGGALLLGLSFTACSDDDYNPMPIQLTNVTTLDDMNTPITEAAMGDFIAIHGTGLDVRNIDSVLINDVALDMLEVYTESDILFLKIPVKLPKEETNKIYIYNSTLVIGHCVGYDAVYPLRCHYAGHGIRHGLDVDRGLRPVFEHVVDDDGVVLHDGVLAAVRAHEEKHALKTARRGLHGLGEGQALKSGARRAAVGVLFQGLEGPPVLEVVVDGAVGRGHVARAAEQIHGLQEIVHEVAGERIAHQHGAAVVATVSNGVDTQF